MKTGPRQKYRSGLGLYCGGGLQVSCMQHSCHSFLCGEGRDSEEVVDMWHTSEVFNFVLGGGGDLLSGKHNKKVTPPFHRSIPLFSLYPIQLTRKLYP